MKTKDYKGITLIALIITIIVLLILAGVSIAMVVGDNGVLGQAVNATVATDIADVKEQIELGVIGYLDNNGDYTIKDVEKAVADAGATLNEDGVTVTTAKGNTFDISDLVNGAYIPTYTGPWYYDDDGNVTNGSVTLAIGDTVYYNAVTGASTISYTSPSSASGFSGYEQTFTLTSDNAYSWQIMGADEDTGELLIVLSYNSSTGYNYLKTDLSKYYYLIGQTGYANCADELDNICSLFGQGYGATGARSITVEDVNKLTGYDPDEAAYGSGSLYQYGNEVTYYWDGSVYPYYTSTYTDPGNLGRSHNASGYGSSFFWYDTATQRWKSSPYNSGATLEEITTLTSNSYYYTSSDYSTNSSVVFPVSGLYWMASRFVSCGLNYTSFGCRYVLVDAVDLGTLFASFGYTYSECGGVRPAVSLGSDISLSGSSADGWTID